MGSGAVEHSRAGVLSFLEEMRHNNTTASSFPPYTRLLSLTRGFSQPRGGEECGIDCVSLQEGTRGEGEGGESVVTLISRPSIYCVRIAAPRCSI